MTQSDRPWFQRCQRWGQTNLTEIDALDYDADRWREVWRAKRTQGVIVNAGGLVAYYPSRFEHQYRARFLGERDLFGEICSLAREDGLAVIARMDSSQGLSALAREHPDWFVHDKTGDCGAGSNQRCTACVNSPYYHDYLPAVIEEIAERYRPDGFADNSWTGMGRRHICYCPHCREKFRREIGEELPGAVDWKDPVYRAWVRWSYRCRLDVWERYNAAARKGGGPDCLWLGMVNSDPILGHVDFADIEAIGRRTPFILCDQQSRIGAGGFEQNAFAGKILHEVSSWSTPVAESMSLYVRAPAGLRLAAAPEAEAALWITEGIAGGITPWWHIVGARAEDRRKLASCDELFRWQADNEHLLFDREPVAHVGLLWSQENVDFFGRDHPLENVHWPLRGWVKALVRRRIPHLPVHARHIRRQIGRLEVLVLPGQVVLADDEIAALGEFVAAGGSLIAGGAAGGLDSTGAARAENPLHALFGVEWSAADAAAEIPPCAANSYLDLPEDAPAGAPRLRDWFGNATDILGHGGHLTPAHLLDGGGAVIAVGHIPSFRGYPPEFAWIRERQADTPAITVREHPSGGRLVWLGADIDRRYGQCGLPDHGETLTRLLDWTLRGRQPIRLDGPGSIDLHVYRQQGRLILHLVNLAGANLWPAYHEETLPLGPQTLRIAADLLQTAGIGDSSAARCAVSGRSLEMADREGDARAWTLPRLDAHALVVIE